MRIVGKTMLVQVLLVMVAIDRYTAPPVGKEQKEFQDTMRGNTDGLTPKQAQDQEYFRYLTQIVGELEKDPVFKEKLNNASEEDIRSGRIADHFTGIGVSIRKKLDELKRMEVEYQRDLLRQKKDHMTGVERNYWNPIHHDNKETFEAEDLKKLLSKHNDMMSEQDKQRREEFKKHEMQKDHERNDRRKNMTNEERKIDDELYKSQHNPKHEKLHEPGHKKQMEEVWEKEDGLDPDSFDPKTFFNLHDKNGDNYLDMFELETFFLSDLDKVYNESDPNSDPQERNEEMERMREHVLKNIDTDKDGLISYEEFMRETKKEDFEKDEEWKPLAEEEQYTDEEYKEYERMLAEAEQHNGEPEQHPDEHHDQQAEQHPDEHHDQQAEHHPDPQADHHEQNQPNAGH